MSQPRNARVLLVDDHPAVREALAIWIERLPGMAVCGEADDTIEALRLAAESRPDVAVVDISLRTGDGIDLVKRLKAHDAEVRILVWSGYSEMLYATRALRAGALGYITKQETSDQIIKALLQVLAGKVYLSPTVTEMLLRQATEEVSAPVHHRIDLLSDRELEVFRLIGQEVRTREIAERLHLSAKTVETYCLRIRTKLGLTNGTELAQLASRWVREKQ